MKCSEPSQSKEHSPLKRALSNILIGSRANLEVDGKKTLTERSINMIGEFYEDAKILNEQERIDTLTKIIEERKRKSNNKLRKRISHSQRANHQRSQKISEDMKILANLKETKSKRLITKK